MSTERFINVTSCFVINLLNNKTIILLNLAEYRHRPRRPNIRLYSAPFRRIIVQYFCAKWRLLFINKPLQSSTFFCFIYIMIFNNYPARQHGISSDTQPTRLQAESAKIRRYSARLSRIFVLIFNKLITKQLVTFLNLSVDTFSLHFFFPRTKLHISPDICYLRMTDIDSIMTIFGQCYNLLNNKLGYLPAGIICSSKLTIFLKLSSRPRTNIPAYFRAKWGLLFTYFHHYTTSAKLLHHSDYTIF